MGDRDMADRRETPFSNIDDTDFGRLQHSRHEENGKRFAAIESELKAVKADAKESVEILRSIQFGGALIKWLMGIAAAVAVVTGTAWAIYNGHK